MIIYVVTGVYYEDDEFYVETAFYDLEKAKAFCKKNSNSICRYSCEPIKVED